MTPNAVEACVWAPLQLTSACPSFFPASLVCNVCPNTAYCLVHQTHTHACLPQKLHFLGLGPGLLCSFQKDAFKLLSQKMLQAKSRAVAASCQAQRWNSIQLRPPVAFCELFTSTATWQSAPSLMQTPWRVSVVARAKQSALHLLQHSLSAFDHTSPSVPTVSSRQLWGQSHSRA